MRKIRAKARAVPDSEMFGTANSGTKQVGFRVEVLEGELAGQSFPFYCYFTEKAGKRAFESIKTAGWVDDDNGWRAFMDKKLPGLGSTEFELQLEEEEDKDENGNPAGVYWSPAFINKIGVAMRHEMSESEARAFGTEMRAMYGMPASSPARGARPAVAARPSPAPARQLAPDSFDDGAPLPSDDDIHF